MYKVLACYQAPKKQYPVSARIVEILPNEFVVFVEHENRWHDLYQILW